MAMLTQYSHSLLFEVVKYALPLFVTYALVLITYRLFLHPLSGYPGPFLARISDLCGAYYASQKKTHIYTWKNHCRYGPVVRVGPNKLVFSSVTALRDIYKSDRAIKTMAYKTMGSGGVHGNIFTTSDKYFHRGRRQLIGQVLTERSLRAFEPTMMAQIDVFLRELLKASSQGKPVNMTERTRRLGINIAALVGFGYDLQLQTSDANRWLLEVVDAGPGISIICYHSYRWLRNILRLARLWSLRDVRRKYMNLLDKIVTFRTSQDKDAIHDLYKFVADSLSYEAGGLRQSELWAEASVFLSAAGETTNTAISSTLFYLSRNPHAYTKLAHEISTTFPTRASIRGPALSSSCPYLRACIDESLRLSPPVPGILWRCEEQQQDEDENDDNKSPSFTIDGHPIPRGTSVGVNTYSLHRDPTYFSPDPFAYRPERWLDDDESEAQGRRKTRNRMREAFAPFSIGSRACAGKGMAYMEAGLVVAETLWCFDFSCVEEGVGGEGGGEVGKQNGLGRERERGREEENENEFRLEDVFASRHQGPWLVFKARADVDLGLELESEEDGLGGDGL
ncbi:cytochrome P450 [Xylariomycetidae sp. FL2044]|nr:cytochrome P450 [Xylariomycetidae sp. FL2044]